MKLFYWKRALLPAFIVQTLFIGRPIWAVPCDDLMAVGELVQYRNGHAVRWDGEQEVVTDYHSLDYLYRYTEVLPEDLKNPAFMQGKTVVDVGSNKGNFIFHLLQLAREQGVEMERAYSVDIEPTVDHPLVIQDDFFNSSISDKSVDILYSSWSIFWYESRNPALLKKAFEQAYRVLKPGGRLVIIRAEPRDFEIYKELIEDFPGLTMSERSRVAEESPDGVFWGFVEAIKK